jgi:hypothetical protein
MVKCPLPSQRTPANRLEDRRDGSGGQNKAFLVPAVVAEGKTTLFWSPLWQRVAKKRFFMAR